MGPSMESQGIIIFEKQREDEIITGDQDRTIKEIGGEPRDTSVLKGAEEFQEGNC